MNKLINKLLSPSIRFELREVASYIKELIDRICIWRWEIARIIQRDDSLYDMLYVGRKSQKYLAKILLGVKEVSDVTQAEVKQSSCTVFISELPIPGSLCVPKYLRTIVPLERPIEELMANYDDKLRRTLLRNRMRYRQQQAQSLDEIEDANRKMIQSFAKERHGNSAYILSDEMILKYALKLGRLDLLLFGNEVVGCMLGYMSIRKGKKYWVADRCGYPQAVSSDLKRLSEANSINHHLTIEWASNNGFDYCDFARCFARPDDGLLQFKKNRGAALDTIGLRSDGCFYIRLPKVGVAQFLWDTPLFSIERNKLILHLGLPDGLSDDEIFARYRRMGFSGLFKVYLHCVSRPSEQFLAKMRDLYAKHNPQPVVEIISST